MRRLATGLLIIVVGAYAASAMAQTDAARAADCSTYARNRSEAEAPAGGGTIGSAARGAAGGALIGAIVGGGKGAKRGAAIGGLAGGVHGSTRTQKQRQSNYQYYYDACMRGER
jgi:hypothetical protein